MAERLQSVADGATQKGREKVESCRDMVGGSFNKLGHTAATVSAVGESLSALLCSERHSDGRARSERAGGGLVALH